MFFYTLFALCIPFRRRIGLTLAFSLLAFLVALGQLVTFQNEVLWAFTQAYLVAFLLGMTLGLVRVRWGEADATLGEVPGKQLLVLAIVILGNFVSHRSSVGSAIGDAFATVAVGLCVLTAEPHDASNTRLDRALQALGASSYSLYLAHGFWLLLVGVAWRKLFGGEHLFGYWVTCTGGSVVLGHLCFRGIERPLQDGFKRLMRRPAVP